MMNMLYQGFSLAGRGKMAVVGSGCRVDFSPIETLHEGRVWLWSQPFDGPPGYYPGPGCQ